MVLRSYIRIISATCIFIILSLLFSCEKLIYNCSECVTNEPDNVYLEINLDGIPGGSKITIYEGNLENNLVFASFVSYSKDSFYKVPLNKTYTLTAEYLINGKSYIAVNSVKPRVLFEEEQCTDPCYYVYNKTVNLKLKNVK